ncbi:HTH-type transcriptional regulator TtgR [compost metagenome]
MRRTKEDAEKTRCAILQAAEVLFLEKGVAHTSLDTIARHAGVTRGAVYWHFQNKAHLFHEMLNQVRLPPEHMAALLGGEDACASLLALRNLCIETLEDLARDQQKRRIFTILLHRCEFTEELREAEERHKAFIDQFIALTERLFAHTQTRGNLRPGLTPAIASRALHALLVGLFADWLRDPSLFDPLQDSEAMIDSMFRGLLHDWNPRGCGA